MKLPAAVHVSVLLLSFAFGFTGCGRSDEPPAETRAEATPSPTPTPEQDLVAVASDKLKHKTDKAIKSLTGFLHNEDPRFQAKLQKLTDKMGHDKDKARKQIQKFLDSIPSRTEQLREKAAKLEGENKDDLNRQLADLEAQKQNWEKKSAELGNATLDELKKLKAELKDMGAKDDAPQDKSTASPTPSAP